MFRPLGPPMDDNATNTERAGMLSGIVLNDAFKAVELEIVLAAIAEEKFLTILLRKRLDLCVENPFHILQNQLLSERTIRRVDNRLMSSSSGCCFVLCNFCIESFTHIN